jgi:arylsulfatase A-like enzyme
VCEHGINLSEAIPVIGDSLVDAGYSTSLFGKAHFRNAEADLAEVGFGSNRPAAGRLWYGPYFGFQYVELCKAKPQGHWRAWLRKHHPEAMELCNVEQATEPPTGAFQCWKNAMPEELYHTHWIVDRTIEWLRALPPEQPFFSWVSFPDPHHPFCPPAPFHSMYDPDELPDPIAPQEDLSDRPEHYRWVVDEKHLFRGSLKVGDAGRGRFAREMKAMYYGMISMIDNEVGRLVDELRRLALDDKTHVIFTSDHGEALMDHGVFGKPPLAYESIMRVPFLWRKPDTIAAGSRFDGVASNSDLAPTILELAGAEPLAGMDGRSFAPVLTGRSNAHRDAVMVERMAVTHANIEPVVRYKVVITKDWKLVAHGQRMPWELYYLPTDPHQQSNLWGNERYAGDRRRMIELLLTEIIDSELGDVAALWRAQKEHPFGAFRDPSRIESQR